MKALFTLTLWLFILTAYSQTKVIHLNGNVECSSDSSFKQRAVFDIHDSIAVTQYKTGYWTGVYNRWKLYFKEDAFKAMDEAYYKVKILEADSIKTEMRKEELAENIRKRHLIKKYGQKLGIFIYRGYIRLGMTKSETIDSWGEPSEVHRTVTVSKVSEQWVYSLSRYVYFTNGVLSAWQD